MLTRLLIASAAVSIATASLLARAPVPQHKPWQPGLGEYMVGIQRHHAALFFAGKAGNWELASFELKELEEGFGDAQEFQPLHEKVDVKSLLESILPPVMKPLHESIEKGDKQLFSRGFEALTSACNGCHQAANVPFLDIVDPTAEPTVNQRYEKR
ncbi:MAG: hypothetical protein IPJ19_12225 [Planctomycetes bacterium]|nr:hypothetical protein [Planctomycetota bacterium]